MLEWIVIALVIALIFGVIKIDDLRHYWEKLQPRLQEIWSKAKSWSETKAKEAKALAEQKKIAAKKEEKHNDNSDDQTL